MASTKDGSFKFEGKWEDIVRNGNQFAGMDVRVTVEPRQTGHNLIRQERIERWLAKVDAAIIPTNIPSKPSEYGDYIVEKYRKQGLEI